MIKATVKIYKPFSQEGTSKRFMRPISKSFSIKMYHGHLYKKWTLKKDDIGRKYLEVVHIFSDMETAKKYEAGVNIKKLERLGYKWEIKYFEIPEVFTKLYMETLMKDFEACGDSTKGCDCAKCKWVRSIDIPDYRITEGVPTNLDEIETKQ